MLIGFDWNIIYCEISDAERVSCSFNWYFSVFLFIVGGFFRVEFPFDTLDLLSLETKNTCIEIIIKMVDKQFLQQFWSLKPV